MLMLACNILLVPLWRANARLQSCLILSVSLMSFISSIYMLLVLTSRIFTNKDAVVVLFSRIFTISGRIIKILQECAVRACPAVKKLKRWKSQGRLRWPKPFCKNEKQIVNKTTLCWCVLIITLLFFKLLWCFVKHFVASPDHYILFRT